MPPNDSRTLARKIAEIVAEPARWYAFSAAARARYEALFRAFGWDVVILKYGSLQQQAFAEPGGEILKAWIDQCPNQLYSALVFQGAAAWRKRLMQDLGNTAARALIERRSDRELTRPASWP